MADLILAKLALWGTDIDTFELAASRSDSDGTLSAMLVPHDDPTLQILLTHELGYPVYLLSYSSVPAEMFSDPRLDDILLDIEETRPANVTVRRQGEGELETSLWIYEEAFDRQSINLAVSEMSVIRRILSRRLQALAGASAERPLAPPPQAIATEADVPELAVEPPAPRPEPAPAPPVEEPGALPELDPVALNRPVESTSQGSAGRARRGGSLPFVSPAIPRESAQPVPAPQPEPASPPAPAPEPALPQPAVPTFDPFAAKTPGKPSFDPFAAKSGPKQGPATIFPGGKQPMKVLPTLLPGLGSTPQAAAQTPASDTKNCPNCNGELRSKARFCTWCGHRF